MIGFFPNSKLKPKLLVATNFEKLDSKLQLSWV